jgi:hypothetical protein
MNGGIATTRGFLSHASCCIPAHRPLACVNQPKALVTSNINVNRMEENRGKYTERGRVTAWREVGDPWDVFPSPKASDWKAKQNVHWSDSSLMNLSIPLVFWLFSVICRWFRDLHGQLRPVTQTLRVMPSQDVLHIRHLSPEDAGRWVCRVSNQFGEQRLETQLIVTAQLSAHVQPQLQV